jgi:hypothetical protein
METQMTTIKLGDRYAVLSQGLNPGTRVSGPYYVTSIRGSLVSLGTEAVPNPKAVRSYRITNEAGDLRDTAPRWSHTRAEPWTEKHEMARRRQRLIAKLEDVFKAKGRENFEGIPMTALARILVLLDMKEETNDTPDHIE